MIMENIPWVRADYLSRYHDGDILRQAFPSGYRLRGPLLPARPGEASVSAATIERTMASMDAEELAAHDRPH